MVNVNSTLIIITVWYNEEINLPKLFDSLKYIKSKIKIRHIYVDQSSTDKSVEIAKRNWCEIFIHPNKWYADPDKKWAVEELCKDDDWILIMDCDEELSENLSNEIINTIEDKQYDVLNIYVKSIILGGFWGRAYQPRLFIKKHMNITDEIHNYLKIKTKNIWYLKNDIINDDLKYRGREVDVFVEKLNRYAEKEIVFLEHMSKLKIVLNLFWKPLQWFFGFGIIHKQFFRWIKWIIICSLVSQYQFWIYSKLYEKKFINK